MKAILCLAAIAAAADVAFGLYFHVNYGDERCFYENVPEMAMLSMNYDIMSEEGIINRWMVNAMQVALVCWLYRTSRKRRSKPPTSRNSLQKVIPVYW